MKYVKIAWFSIADNQNEYDANSYPGNGVYYATKNGVEPMIVSIKNGTMFNLFTDHPLELHEDVDVDVDGTVGEEFALKMLAIAMGNGKDYKETK